MRKRSAKYEIVHAIANITKLYVTNRLIFASMSELKKLYMCS